MAVRAVDVVVVGAGTAGSAFAGRLSEAPGRTVLLLEAGGASWPPEIRDVTSLAATDPRHPWNWAHPARLRARRWELVPRGRGLGGSSAINGAAWVRVTPADADGWGMPGWGWADLLPHYIRSEDDRDLCGPLHGRGGPVPVQRPSGALLHPAAERFLAAAARLGYPAEPDLNAGGAPGAGLVPSNSVDGVRVNAAMAYLAAYRAGERPGLTVRTGASVLRIVLDGTRAVGVELVGGEIVEAGEVVLAAGGIGTPELLLRSGIGPGDGLRAAGVAVRHELPGVGQGFSDHPAVFVPFADTDPPVHDGAPATQAALNFDTGADPPGDAEVLLFVRPFVVGGPLHAMCLLQQPDSRGTITLDAAGEPVIEHHYLRTEHDRRRLRHAIRTAAELLRAGLGSRVDPPGDVLGNDRRLDGWIAAHLTTAAHLCGSAAMGPVVDPDLRVRGLDGLRVVDVSVLPTVPRRGPAATAVAIGEKAATTVENEVVVIQKPR
ncbi:GMC family oxidoreductase [Pseudonocardia sp. GCM10023141]|uniref:GMC family oxidoreductase n=1 Tax=Pseudonocardia sp. GCM10023141 TaxID=3252653 RepID=UPI00361D116A